MKIRQSKEQQDGHRGNDDEIHGERKAGGTSICRPPRSRNAIIRYERKADGSLDELERVATGGAGSGVFKPISGQESAPNAFEGAASVILTPDRRLMFATNGGDNSVSSFLVSEDGGLKLLDIKPTGNPVEGKSGDRQVAGLCSLQPDALRPAFVRAADHLRLMSVDAEGKLTPRPEGYTVNTYSKRNRVATMVVISPDEQLVLVGTTFDEPIRAHRPVSRTARRFSGSSAPAARSTRSPRMRRIPTASAAFRLQKDGSLGTARFYDAKGGSPFYIAFPAPAAEYLLSCVFFAVLSWVLFYCFFFFYFFFFFFLFLFFGRIARCAPSRRTAPSRFGSLVKIDTSAGVPTELCWLAVSPDDRTVYATNFGFYSNISSYRINGHGLEVARDPACPRVPGDGTARGLNGTVTSGPSDSWITSDGAYLYQIYGNASKLVGYATQPDGSLTEISSVKIPYNSPQGLAGF